MQQSKSLTWIKLNCLGGKMLVSTCISKEGRTVLGWVGELYFCFCLGLMWQKVAESWPQNPHGWKAVAPPTQCMYVLDLCKMDYTRHSQTKQLPASGNPASVLWLPQCWIILSFPTWL